VGTEGYGTLGSPANDPYVITVGAMNTVSTASRADDVIASYSSKGPTAIDHIVKPDRWRRATGSSRSAHKVQVCWNSCTRPTEWEHPTSSSAAPAWPRRW